MGETFFLYAYYYGTYLGIAGVKKLTARYAHFNLQKLHVVLFLLLAAVFA